MEQNVGLDGVDTPWTVMTTRAPAVLIMTISRYKVVISGGTQCMVISLGEEENDRGSVRIHKSRRPLPWQQWWLKARGQDDNDDKNHTLWDSRGIELSR